MNTLFKVLILALLIVVIDFVYLKSIAPYFNKQITAVQGSGIKMDYISAVICYIFIVIALYHFIIRKNAPVRDAMILGWCIYMIYELTTKALITRWSWTTVLIDGIWGGILFGLVTVVYRLIHGETIKF
jgi:uncharacterized membrane protein